MSVKTRFCPSPTGLLHLGNLRTALFSWLYARKMGGSFLLRIEDTDRERSKEAYVEALCDDLELLGLPWDEGPRVGGALGPYYQSERQAVYDEYLERLKAEGRVYPCFCSEEALALERKVQLSMGQPPRYSERCLKLSEAERERNLSEGLIPTWRFHVDEGEPLVFEDLVFGKQTFARSDLSDFVVRRRDGTAPFLYSNALDDALMGVTHVLRGEDHISNTPRQRLLLEALGLPIPQYGHLPLILGADGTPLAKRHGSRHLRAMLDDGLLPLGILNYLARLGHHCASHECFDLETMAASFDITSIGQAPARYDGAQLEHWQSQALAKLSDEAFCVWAGISDASEALPLKLVRPLIRERKDLAFWLPRFTHLLTDYEEEAEQLLKETDVHFFKHALACYTQDILYTEWLQALKAATHLSGKSLFLPLRAALMGTLSGPDLSECFKALGQGRVRARLEAVLGICKI